MIMRRFAVRAMFCAVTMVPLFVSAASCEGICNPLNAAISNIPSFISTVLHIMVQVGLPVVAFFLLYSGYLFVSAGGNPSKLEKAKENFMYVIIGTLLILGAWVIATLIANTVSQVVGTSVNVS